MDTSAHSRSRRRLVRTLLLVGTLTATSLFATSIPAAAGSEARGISGCALTSKKPGISATGLKAFGRFSFFCIVGNLPFQYQIAVWEQDAGADTRLSITGWRDATLDASGTYNGKGPQVLCQTEPGTEELYTRVRVRVGGETSAWENSPLETSKTCQ